MLEYEEELRPDIPEMIGKLQNEKQFWLFLLCTEFVFSNSIWNKKILTRNTYTKLQPKFQIKGIRIDSSLNVGYLKLVFVECTTIRLQSYRR